jgi:hypothetical protein
MHNPGVLDENVSEKKERWDFFIIHVLEDKREIVAPLADALNANGLISWYADYCLKLGDNMRASIDYGLARSRFGIVILSKQFLEKRWPQGELNDLAARKADGKNAILPIWHKVGFRDVYNYSPILADRPAISTDKGLEYVVKRIVEATK